MPVSALSGPNYYRPVSINITPMAPEALGGSIRHFQSAAWASAVWPTANLAILYPFTLHRPITAVGMFVANGATISGTAHFDIGIYDDGAGTSSLNRIVSMGSTVATGTNVPQTANIADTQLAPGRYYMALCLDTNTDTTFSKAPAQAGFLASIGYAQCAVGAVTLPDPITIAAMTTPYIPLFGLSQRTTV